MIKEEKATFRIFRRFFGVTVVPEVLKCQEFSPLEKLVWATVREFAIHGEPCTKTNEELGELMGMSGKSFGRVVDRLLEIGLLQSEPTKDGIRQLFITIPSEE